MRRLIMSSDETGMAGLTQDELEQRIRDEYARLRAAWFPQGKPAWLNDAQWTACQQTANLTIAWDDPTANCGYINNANQLIIAAEEGWLYLGPDLMEDEPPEAAYAVNAQADFTHDWSPWRVFLVHELCHEYQFKVLLNDERSPRGRDLHHTVCCQRNQHVRWRTSGQHPLPFLEAIAALAEYLGADRVRLYDML
jgi:hypothetical protein